MEIEFGKPEEFLNIDDEIRKLTENIDGTDQLIADINKAYEERRDQINEKIARLQELLNEAYQTRTSKVQKAKIQLAADRTRRDALVKEKKQQAELAKMDEVVNLIKEITAEFAAWSAAREYQVEDIVQIVQQYLAGSNGILNANEMSLGKTFETLVALFIITQIFIQKNGRPPKTLWLTKSSIVETGGTVAEAKRWYPGLKIFAIRGSANEASLDIIFELAESGGLTVVTNYETVKKLPKIGRAFDWDIMITDEVHKLKGGANPGGPTDIWKAVKDLSWELINPDERVPKYRQKLGFHMMLSGTPMVNRIEEMWSYLHLFDPHVFPSAKEFASAFRAYRHLSGELKLDASSENMMRQILRGRLIRRTAKEVGIQMPPVNRETVWLKHNTPHQDKLYQQVRDQFFVWLDEQNPESIIPISTLITRLLRLRQINTGGKIKFKLLDDEGNWNGEYEIVDVSSATKLDEALDIVVNTNDQVIIGSNFNDPLESLARQLRSFGYTAEVISGEHMNEMKTYEKDFQAKKIDVLLINMAMGEGMNLHKDPTKWEGGARAVVILDRWYNNARNDQFVARAVRPQGSGTEVIHEPVFVYDLKVEHSVDLWIQELNDAKEEQANLITGSDVARPAKEWKERLRKLL